VIRQFLLAGTVLILLGGFLRRSRPARKRLALLGTPLGAAGAVCLALGAAMTAYGLRGKFNMRDLMLARINWQGGEQVLDIGTGRGLLAIGAAKRLTTGSATGIDIWRAEDLSGNTAQNALRNAALEGVKDKLVLRTEDVRKMSFPDASFDVVLSLLCLHNIEDRKEQADACREIARVLKPGGTALIADYVPTRRYASALAQAGLTVESSRSYLPTAYGLMWMVAAAKETRPT
jgi:ubiquinone/menaquinone biosynthesis C-methylase UbiE